MPAIANKICANCGLAFKAKKKRSKFCSIACNAQSQMHVGPKLCARCKQPGMEFSKNSSRRDGLCHTCKKCLNHPKPERVGPKLCARCKQPGDFPKDRARKDGLYHTCKKCLNHPKPARVGPKLCGKCGQPGEFYKSKKYPDGLDYKCKKCALKEATAWQANNPERVKTKRALWKKVNAEKVKRDHAEWYAGDRDRILAWQKNYNDAHRTEAAERVAAYYAKPENLERRRLAGSKWSKANRAARAAMAHRRRVRIAAIDNTLTTADIEIAIEMSGGICAHCLKPYDKPTIDHVISVCAKGSSNAADNIVISCRRCNSIKGNRGVLFMINKLWSVAGRDGHNAS